MTRERGRQERAAISYSPPLLLMQAVPASPCAMPVSFPVSAAAPRGLDARAARTHTRERMHPRRRHGNPHPAHPPNDPPAGQASVPVRDRGWRARARGAAAVVQGHPSARGRQDAGGRGRLRCLRLRRLAARPPPVPLPPSPQFIVSPTLGASLFAAGKN